MERGGGGVMSVSSISFFDVLMLFAIGLIFLSPFFSFLVGPLLEALCTFPSISL